MTTRVTLGSTALRRTFIAMEETSDSGSYSGIRTGTKDSVDRMLIGGNLTITPEAEPLMPIQNRNSLSERHGYWHLKRGTALSWDGVADFNQVVDFLRMSVTGHETITTIVTPSQGQPGIYQWVFLPRNHRVASSNLVARNNQNPYTFWHMDGSMWDRPDDIHSSTTDTIPRIIRVPYVLCSELGFNGSMGATVNVTANMFGRSVEFHPQYVSEHTTWNSGAVTASMNNTSQMMVTSNTQVSIADANGNNSGWMEIKSGSGTALKQTVRSWEFTLPTGLEPFYAPRGPLRDGSGFVQNYGRLGMPGDEAKFDFTGYVEKVRSATVKLTMVSNDNAWNQFREWLYLYIGSDAGSRIQTVRIEVDGDNIGSSTTPYRMQIDANVIWDENPEIYVDDEGVSMVVLTGHTYDDHHDNSSVDGWSTGNDFQITVWNSRAS